MWMWQSLKVKGYESDMVWRWHNSKIRGEIVSKCQSEIFSKCQSDILSGRISKWKDGFKLS